MADELLPVVRLADWKDRASVAQTAGKDYRLRELRAVVAASRTVNLDEEGRTMAKALQESLDQRTTALREEWLARITNALNDGRVQQALEASIRPPEPGTRLPGRAGGAAGRGGRGGDDGRASARGVDAPARRRRGLTGAADGEAVGHPGRRGGPAGGPPRRRLGAGAGQAARSAHPAPPAAPGAPSAGSVQPAAERQQPGGEPGRLEALLGGRSPGSARASTSAQPFAAHQARAASMSAAPTPTPGRPAST